MCSVGLAPSLGHASKVSGSLDAARREQQWLGSDTEDPSLKTSSATNQTLLSLVIITDSNPPKPKHALSPSDQVTCGPSREPGKWACGRRWHGAHLKKVLAMNWLLASHCRAPGDLSLGRKPGLMKTACILGVPGLPGEDVGPWPGPSRLLCWEGAPGDSPGEPLLGQAPQVYELWPSDLRKARAQTWPVLPNWLFVSSMVKAD